jgi:hypothetical protein
LARIRPRLKPENQALCLLNLARWSDGAAENEVRRLAQRGLSWEEMGRLAELNAVAPLTLKNVGAAGLTASVPHPVLEAWETATAAVRAAAAARQEHGGRLLAALERAGVETIVLKGSLFAASLYGNPAYKKMNDVDLLVRFADAERALATLRAEGFRGVGELFGEKEISARSHHAPPYVSEDLACVIGPHWGLCSPLAPWRPDLDGIWERKAPVEVAGARAWRMSWEDNLLHLCIHLPFFKIGLRELADVYNVALFAEPGIDWPRFDALVARWRAEDAAYRVLRLTDALVDLGIPAAMLERWRARARAFTREDTDARAARPDLILESRSTQVARIEKAYAVFKLTGKYSERARAWAGMWAGLLWPKEAEALKLSGLEPGARGWRARSAARLRAPAKLWRAMAREHGQVPLAAMTAINAGILVRDTVLRPFRPDGEPLSSHPAAPLLKVLE